MVRYILQRLAVALLVALTVSLLSFALLRLSGDPATALAGEGARAEDIEQVRRSLGLDRPLLVQYGSWLWRCLQGRSRLPWEGDRPLEITKRIGRPFAECAPACQSDGRHLP